MGAAASVEASKPQDASDVRATNDLEYAKTEVIRLRNALGHLAKLAGIDAIVLDASDIVLGVNHEEDFVRCINELAHIRSLLRMHTQNDKRKARSYPTIFRSELIDQLEDGSDGAAQLGGGGGGSPKSDQTRPASSSNGTTSQNSAAAEGQSADKANKNNNNSDSSGSDSD